MPFFSDEEDDGIGEFFSAKFDVTSFFYKAPSKIEGFWVLYRDHKIDFSMLSGQPDTTSNKREELMLVSNEPKFEIDPRASGGSGPTLNYGGIYARFEIHPDKDGSIQEIIQTLNYGQFFSTQKEIISLSLRASIAFNSAILQC